MRQTVRKQRILDILNLDTSSGVSLLNELRIKCRWRGEFSNSNARISDNIRSFNRTIFMNFPQISTHQLATKGRGFNKNITVGLFARWAFWELIEQGFISSCSETDRIEFTLGYNACSIRINLGTDDWAVIGNAVFLTDIHIICNREMDTDDILRLSEVNWPIYGMFNGQREKVANSLPLNETDKLNSWVNITDGRKMRTNKPYMIF